MDGNHDFQPEPPAHELDWGPVVDCLALLEGEFDAGGWAPSWTDDEGVTHLGYASLSDDAMHVVRVLGEQQVVAPFDWPDWMQAHGSSLLANIERVADADLEDCRRLLTALVRGDRFSEGMLLGMFQRGVVAAILRRVEHILTTTED